jgi:alanyl-tRNA synthetase
MKNTSQIRSTFLDYFKKNDHTLVSSSPVIPENDPTLLFTNAGMVQFKNIFTGQEKRGYTKAASSQKCIRAGGKHNDLDNVGYTARHHTFFEMLGNFSFGDYFKEEAIFYAWNLLTQHFCLDKKKLLVTVYAEDHEAYALWKKLTGFSDDKIIRISTKDNFWSMGNTGPCGPCTEVFYDYGDHIFGGPPGSADENGDRFTEIWNLVFMQYEQVSEEKRINLPQPSIDTGMGLERIASVLQGVHNNYDTDLFQHIIKNIQALTNNKGSIQSYRIMADHLRSVSFMLSDGINPSNEGRGYVLRRIMRRAMRHIHLIEPQKVLMHKFVPFLIDVMGDAYPELKRNEIVITNTFKNEEERFKLTLDKGLKLLNEEKLKINNHVLSGEVAFKLYDTYGFPLDLTEDILKNEKISVDTIGFEKAMKDQKDLARSMWKGSGDQKEQSVYFSLQSTLSPTEFLGYEHLESKSKILAIIQNGRVVDEALEGDEVFLICDKTPFYGESGGQIGDAGILKNEDVVVHISDTQNKLNHFIVHHGVIKQGTLKNNDVYVLSIDKERRAEIAGNHSATHLLQAALRLTLGHHISQKGSLVTDQKLRFDFTHNQALSAEEINKIESIINTQILKNVPRETKLMDFAEAIDLGALSLSGEKYDSQVRVVSFDKNKISVELCGGIHVNATGEIGLFKIISETGIAAGIRRIEAITGKKILSYLKDIQLERDHLKNELKEKTLAFSKQKEALEQEKLLLSVTGFDDSFVCENVTWGIKNFNNINASDLRAITDKLLRISPGIVVLTNRTDEKISIAIAVSAELTQKYNAANLIKFATTYLGGKGGGGKPDFAQGGGVHPDKIRTLLKALLESTTA